ncbi:hypothetical protein ACHAWU_007064 [Discostella pseudostelligera]|uniref:Complex 1 LYR protein domain-containing protein n=1 Tax=Discostella pseudostelligera TaxID=259834 RepID=A0ABD3N190_9STRA
MLSSIICRTSFASARSVCAAERLLNHSRTVASASAAGNGNASPTSSSGTATPPPSTPTPSPPAAASSESTTTTAESTRLRALSLYRRLLRGSQRMPTPNRQNYVLRKTRLEFRKHMHLTDEMEIDFQLRLADTNLDTVLVQAEHLSRLFNDPEYQNYN